MISNKNIPLFLNILKATLAGLGVLFCILVIGGPNVNEKIEVVEAFRDSTKMDLAIYYMIGLISAGVVLILLFFLIQLITQSKKTVMSIIGILAALVIYLIFYAAGTSDTSASLLLKNPVSDGVVVTTTAGLYTVGVALFAGIVAIVVFPIINFFKK
ncbi:MAG: hypothetical protein P8I93_05085 [Crocinitomicaceae bacterium]|nr:hypothetical protein [Crocinitomicaceae bacterium]